MEIPEQRLEQEQPGDLQYFESGSIQGGIPARSELVSLFVDGVYQNTGIFTGTLRDIRGQYA
jgi:hypothetical protein